MKLINATLATLIGVLCMLPLGARQKELTLLIPGTLGEQLGNDTTATSLVVRGPIDISDFLKLRSLPALKELNLSDATIIASTLSKEDWLGKKSFEADKFPAYIFTGIKLEKISLPSDMTELGDGAFSSCHELKEVLIGNKLASIGEYAFYDCRQLKSISLPASLAQMGKGTFSGCSALESASLLATGLTIISDETFKGTVALKVITLPTSLATIGNEAFLESGLEEVSLGAKVDSLGNYAFSSMPFLTKASINNAATGKGVLYNNSALQEIKDYEMVSDHGLGECPQLDLTYSQLDNRNSVEQSQPNRHFMENLKSLGNYALAGNGSQYMIFSKGLKNVGSHVFDGMSNLSYINVFDLGAEIPATASDEPFAGINTDSIRLYVDSVFIEEWQNNDNWGKFKIISTTTGVESTTIGDAADIKAEIDGEGILRIESAITLTSVLVADESGLPIAMLSPKSDICTVDLSASEALVIIVKAANAKGSKVFKLVQRKS